MTDDTRIQLRLHFGDQLTFGPGKADLLALIAEKGSIAAAGRAMDMSYKRAWSLVADMNAAFDPPLVQSSRGGPAQGGARVTAAGAIVLAQFRGLEALLRQSGAAELATIARHLRPPAQGGLSGTNVE